MTLNQTEYAANLASRLRSQLTGPAEKDSATAASLAMLEQLDALESLLSWDALRPGASSDRPRSAARAERDCLRGSTWARQAAEETGLKPAARGRLLLRAASYYARAHHDHAALGAAASKRAYALSNAAVQAGMAVQFSAALSARVRAGRWLNALVDPEGPVGASSFSDVPVTIDTVCVDTDRLLADLEQDPTIDFWGYASLIDLRLGRQMLLLAVGGHPDDGYHADLAALPAMVDSALLRWPSPTQLDSLGDRPGQVLKALQHRPRTEGSADFAAWQALVAAVQALLARLEAARRDTGG